jgi:uncharacterized protein (TIGR02118 family)
MITNVAILSKRPHLSDAEFRQYYEEKHAPLILSIATSITDYRRSYIDRASVLTGGISGNPGPEWHPDFDVITELWFKDDAAFQAARAAFTQPDNARRVAEDEEHFLDRSKKRMFFVDEALSHGSS